MVQSSTEDKDSQQTNEGTKEGVIYESYQVKTRYEVKKTSGSATAVS